jgi:hypothetical protein
MAYVSKETKAKIVSLAKPILKKYGMKGTFSVRNHSTITLKLTAGKLDIIGNYIENAELRPKEAYWTAPSGSMDVNVYWITDRYYSGKVLKFLTELLAAMKGADWFDKSDAMTDYFHTAYYISITVGTWDKPYVLLK